MDLSHSIDIEAPAVSHEDIAPSNEEIASGEIEEAASLEDGDPSAEKSTEEKSLVSAAAKNSIRKRKKSLVSSMGETLNALPTRPESPYQMNGPTIFRFPAMFRKNKECFIEPSVVSIGPYHHGRKHLSLMEGKKWLLLKDILSRPNTKVTLEACVEKIKSLQLQARSCYSEIVDIDDDSFVEMLILDGTFIIQYFGKPYEWFQRETGWASICMQDDLTLLENQIPLFVVQSLWDLYFHGLRNYSEFLKNLRRRLAPSEIFQSGDTTSEQNEFHHLVHLCHNYVVPNMYLHVTVLPGCSCFNLCKCVSSEYESRNKVPCATELQNAGIKFRMKKSPYKMMDVTFRGGTLEIPSIILYDTTEFFFVNLLAFEQSQVSSIPRHLTAYLTFIDSIIHTEHDVALLQKHGIIENHLSSEEDVVLFFNQLCVSASREGHDYLSDLKKEVIQYYDSKCHRYRATLIRDYFNSPWSIISFVGALIILGLTFAQTYFAGHDYFHPSPK